MATMNAKNAPLSGVAQDLGLGDSLTQQVQDNLAEIARKKKLMGMDATSNVARDLGLTPTPTFNG
jgi:hypothetical protein